MRARWLLLLAGLALAGCSSRGERLYQRAEQFFIAGQYRLAAEQYRQVVTEEPRNSLADDALYKLAYLYREEMEALPQAAQTYRLLADRYPQSPYADDALLWLIQIQGQRLRDVAAVRETHGFICRRFAGRQDICARAHLELVQALMASGGLRLADSEAQRLLSLYPDQKRQAAAALLVRARLAGKLSDKPEAAIKLYEQLVSNYPDTMGAVEAKRAIGWMYYGEKGKQAQADLAAKRRAARVIGGLPAFDASRGTPRQRPFYALRCLLAQRGVVVSAEEVLAVSGAAFELHYDLRHPGVTASRLSRNALTATAEQYGFAVNVWSSPTAEAGFAALAQSIAQGKPVMVPQAGNGRWLLVNGYRPAEDMVHVVGQGSARQMSRAQFLRRWAPSPRGHTACVTGPYFQLALGQRLQTPTTDGLAQAAARRAAAAWREGASQAYDTLSEQCAAQAAGSSPEDAPRLRQWAQDGLAALLADRRAAVAFISGAVAAAEGDSRGQLSAAAEAYGEAIRTGEQLRAALLAVTRPAQGAEPPPEISWPEVTNLVRQMRAAEERAAETLATVAR